MFDVIAFDADDTLWHSEVLYIRAQDEFIQLLAQYHSREYIEAQLYETEMRNLQIFGYGVKGFTLSLIETAVMLTEGRILGRDIQRIIDLAREMLSADIELLEHVPETIAQLAEHHTLMVLTKGDLLDQEAKIARSGLGSYFQHVEIVSDKTADRYQQLLNRYQVPPGRFLMVGNSLRSDILPVIALGGYAVYVPYELTWVHETAGGRPTDQPRYFELEHVGLLPDLLKSLNHHPT